MPKVHGTIKRQSGGAKMSDTKAQFDQTTRVVRALLRQLDEPKAFKSKKKKHRPDPEELRILKVFRRRAKSDLAA